MDNPAPGFPGSPSGASAPHPIEFVSPTKSGNRTMNVAPIALQPGEGEHLWFLGGLASIKASGANTGGRLAIVHPLAPQGDGSPLHMPRREDESFYILEGEVKFWVGGRVIDAPAGSFVFGPRDIPHT